MGHAPGTDWLREVTNDSLSVPWLAHWQLVQAGSDASNTTNDLLGITGHKHNEEWETHDERQKSADTHQRKEDRKKTDKRKQRI